MSRKFTGLFLASFLICCFLLGGCNGQPASSCKSSGNPEYESQKILVEGEIEKNKEITVEEMRQLPQKELKANFQRTTGQKEIFQAAGPALQDVLAHLGIDVKEYEGIGVVARDGYYCLLTPEIITNRELVLALSIDKKTELPQDMRPARLCAPGEFGPYWVRMVEKIILYKEIPKKDITSLWVFYNLVQGIEPYPYEYYGSKDNAIELAQILSRFEQVNNKAFLTMKSSDGLIKSEALDLLGKDYYIKVAGQDAPMNIAPNIKLGMNVKRIAWFSTNSDAVIFPREMARLIGEKEINGSKGIELRAILEEVQLQDLENQQFEVLGTNGEIITVNGCDLSQGLLLTKDDGSYPLIWQDGTGYPAIGNLLQIRLVD